MSLEPGRTIGTSLRLERLVGRGAMGSVWVAEHLALRSHVAVKFMAQAMLDDPVSLLRFQQEAKAAAEIRSPHVVRVFDHGTTDDGVPFIVMELLDGESLDRRMKRVGRLPVAEVATILRQCARALAKAHERGIVHRDIKPGNIFLSSDEELFVKVVDFGVAKFSGQEAIEMTAQGNMVGTPAYMGPEQLFYGKSTDHRGDLWSLSVVAYQAMTGDRPFDGLTLGELCVSIKRGEYVVPTQLRSDLPAAVDAWFARAFAEDVEARFQSARELAQAFDEAVGASSLVSSTPSLTGPAPEVRASLPQASESVSSPTHPGSLHVTTFSGRTADSLAVDLGSRRRNRVLVGAAFALLALVAGALVALVGGRARGPVALVSSEPATAPSLPSSSALVGQVTTAGPSPASSLEGVGDDVHAPPPASASATATATSAARAPAPLPSSSSAVPRPSSPSGAVDDVDERSKRAGEQLGI